MAAGRVTEKSFRTPDFHSKKRREDFELVVKDKSRLRHVVAHTSLTVYSKTNDLDHDHTASYLPSDRGPCCSQRRESRLWQ